MATVVPAKEFLLNLYRDLMQPSLGSIRPLLVVPGVCLKLPLFGLRRREVEQTVGEPFRRPACCLPQHHSRPGGATPRLPCLPGQVGRQIPT